MSIINLKRPLTYCSGHNDNEFSFQGDGQDALALSYFLPYATGASGFFNTQVTPYFQTNIKAFVKSYLKTPNPTVFEGTEVHKVFRVNTAYFQVYNNSSDVEDGTITNKSHYFFDSAYQLYDRVPDLSKTRFLTSHRITLYVGFHNIIPTAITDLNKVIKINNQTGGVVDTLGTFTAISTCFHNYDEEYIYTGVDDYITLRADGVIKDTVNFRIITPCANGVLLRWKNEHGGFDQHIFSPYSKSKFNQKFGAEINHQPIFKDVQGTLDLHDNDLDMEDFQKVLGIIPSKEIYLFHKTVNKWESVKATISQKITEKNKRGRIAVTVTKQPLIVN